MNKKVKILLIVLPIVLVLAAGAVFGVLYARKNARRAFVMPVSELNNPWAVEGESYSGSVYESARQTVYADAESVVKEVYVKEGDKVKKGDRLFSYDTTLLSLTVEEKELNLKICQSTLENEQRRLEEYRSIVPVVPTEAPPEPEPTEEGKEPEGEGPDPSLADEPEEPEEAEDTAAPAATYTPQEKADMVSDQELVVKKAQNALAFAEQDLKEAKEAVSGATVTAGLDGTVTSIQTVGKEDSAAPFCTVLGSSGVTVKGYVGEFEREALKKGDRLTVTSWMSGTESEAQIVSVSDYPSDGQGYYASGNPNTSCYEFTAFLDNAEGFEIGEEVEIRKYAREDENAVVLEKVYVRTDENGSYVMKDEDGVLKRQNVKIKTLSNNEYVMITEGLAADDLIAFPYGKKGQEGLLTTTEYSFSLF